MMKMCCRMEPFIVWNQDFVVEKEVCCLTACYQLKNFCYTVVYADSSSPNLLADLL